MGRIKCTPVKVLARELMEAHGDKFTTDFDKNKKAVGLVRKIQSKKIRNVVTGCITKEKTRQKKEASS
ncbi:MAG: 30S ribosomal protein S17e [Candidatus Aenigmatarchaeota archaeon]